jgi:cell division protein FtsL
VAEARRHPKMSRQAAAHARRARTSTARVRTSKARARHPSSKVPVEKRPASPRVRRRRTTLSTVLLSLTVVGFLFAFVYPTSTFFRQRSELGASQTKLDRLDAETRRLQEENKKLHGPEEIERIARERYGLTKPGETPYVLVPSGVTTSTTQPVPSDTKPEDQK